MISHYSNVYSYSNGRRIHTITEGVANLMSENSNLQERVTQSIPLLRDHTLMQMLYNRSTKDPLSASQLSELGLSFPDPMFQLAILQFNTEVENPRFDSKSVIRDDIFIRFIEARLQGFCRFFIVPYPPQRIVILFNHPGGENYALVEMRRRLTQCVEEAQLTFSCGIYGGISNNYASIEALPDAFFEASQVLDRQLFHGMDVIGISSTEPIPSSSFYPFDAMGRLICALKVSDDASISNALNEIQQYMQTHFEKRSASFIQVFLTMLESLERSLRGLYDSAKVQEVFVNAYKQIVNANSLAQSLQCFRETTLITADFHHKGNVEETDRFSGEILTYIKSHIAEIYGLQDVSEHFHISATYLYNIVKKEVDVSPGQYLTNIRMRLASEYLLTTDMPIQEVAQKCGIDNIQRFYRNFKRTYGCAPNEYRVINKKSSIQNSDVIVQKND